MECILGVGGALLLWTCYEDTFCNTVCCNTACCDAYTSGKVVFRGNFLIKLTLASKKEETQKQAYSFSLLPAKT